MQLVPRHAPRASFVTAGFYDARTGWQFQVDLAFGEVIEKMDKRKGGAEHQRWQRSQQFGESNFKIQSPDTIRFDLPQEHGCISFHFYAHGFEHVNKGRMRRVFWARRKDQ